MSLFFIFRIYSIFEYMDTFEDALDFVLIVSSIFCIRENVGNSGPLQFILQYHRASRADKRCWRTELYMIDNFTVGK